MRIHRLEVTGFGPFADTARVDFDTLSDAGLFLLSGPTGAGKSSILDAVCFALYGDVPGDRATAKRLRSDHAGDDVVPRVVLEATLSGRRFRIDRSPAWTRPKKRGTGRTTEPARVVVSERRTGADGTDAWHPLSTRLDETGHLVTRLVGMTLPQFCQVALLPQGRFQAFLRARSEERQALLQQVFQTGRFDRVERWLRDRRVELRRAADAQRAAVADLVSRVSEVAATAAPDDWPDAPADLVPWVGGLADRVAAAAAAARDDVVHVGADEEAAARASAEGIALAERRAAHAAAERDLGALTAQEPEQRARRARVEAAQRALAVRPLHDVAASARTEEERLRREGEAARAALAELLGTETVDEQRAAVAQRAATRMLTEVARVRPLRDQAAVTAARLDEAVRQRDAAREALRDLDARAVGLPEELRSLAPEVAAAREAVLHVQSLTTAVEALRVRIRAAESLEEIDARLAESEHALAEVTAARLTAREELLDIRERRLDGMAAEIAGRLAVGACCPVCGSAEHPAPAAPAPGAPDDAAEREARRVVDDLEAVVEAHAQQVRGLEARRAAAEAEAGGTLDQLGTELADALTRLDDARRLAATADGLQTRIAALEQEQSRLTDAREAGAARAAAIDTEVAVLAAQLDDLERQVAEVAPDGADLESLAAHHRDVEAAAARCMEAAADLDRARTASDQASARLELAVQEAGFDSPETAARAWVPVDDLEALRATVERHERDVARLEELLADPELVRAAAADAPDLDALDRALQQARATLAAVRTRHAGLVEQERRLRALVGQVTSAVAAWIPLRDELDLVADLAAMVEGKHPDNRLRMRLSAYVLSHRLGQVVEAANLRLSTMSDQRYSLVHTGQRGAGETRGGLSLLVRDDWTGDSRDPATLSGGETFVVSLALALGLADVITEEAGGADLDTLFVDEGFGSLDADTLEDVMDTLDALRDGGRVVGVVSHVPELQNRIPTQLRVQRGRHGSRISLRAG